MPSGTPGRQRLVRCGCLSYHPTPSGSNLDDSVQTSQAAEAERSASRTETQIASAESPDPGAGSGRNFSQRAAATSSCDERPLDTPATPTGAFETAHCESAFFKTAGRTDWLSLERSSTISLDSVVGHSSYFRPAATRCSVAFSGAARSCGAAQHRTDEPAPDEPAPPLR